MISISIGIEPPTVNTFLDQVTPGSDLIRGDGGRDVVIASITPTLGEQLTPTQQTIVGQLTTAPNVTEAEALEAVFSGSVSRPLDPLEAALYPALFDPAFMATTFPDNPFAPTTTVVLPPVTSARQALLEGAPVGDLYTPIFGNTFPNLPLASFLFGGAFNPAFGDGTVPMAEFEGNDRFFGNGGDDIFIDLAGNNYVVTQDGNDQIGLGDGNDRVIDRGGNNGIFITGGTNNVLTADGDDTIKTGDGDDIVNARDGNNYVDAGDGDNFVRGGEDLDLVRIGTGDDIVEVFAGGLRPDGAGGLEDNFSEVIDLGAFGLGQLFQAHNVVYDAGGDDIIRATASDRDDIPGFVDENFNGDDLVISDISVLEAALGRPVTPVAGTDRIELGGGENLIIDYAGDTFVRTGSGPDTVITSFLIPGDDDIETGGGTDAINPGEGADRIRPGPGGDSVVLSEATSATDTIVFNPTDVLRFPVLPGGLTEAQIFNEILSLFFFSDTILGFDSIGDPPGANFDLFQLNDLDVGLGNLVLFNPAAIGLSFGGAAPDLALFFDADASGFNPAPTSVADVIASVTPGDFVLGVLADFTDPVFAFNFDFVDTMA
ncbi:MAG: hypothetical protein AAF416_17635 [Pseudomonadota bacterium]